MDTKIPWIAFGAGFFFLGGTYGFKVYTDALWTSAKKITTPITPYSRRQHKRQGHSRRFGRTCAMRASHGRAACACAVRLQYAKRVMCRTSIVACVVRGGGPSHNQKESATRHLRSRGRQNLHKSPRAPSRHEAANARPLARSRPPLARPAMECTIGTAQGTAQARQTARATAPPHAARAAAPPSPQEAQSPG